jgi:chemotaxis methyl-accepting protein methylase
MSYEASPSVRSHPATLPATPAWALQTDGPERHEPACIEAILAVVRERTGRDFSAYRPATTHRRILNRMISVGTTSSSDYLAYLQRSADEALRLLERLTIKVSRFYRNRATFDLLRLQELPALEAERGGTSLQVWSAGCGYGEEAYTLAMLLDEARIPGEVVASDIDPGALDTARAGVYADAAVEELPASFVARYLEPVSHGRRGQGYRVSDRIRSRVRFVQHDVTSAGTSSQMPTFDLICCRNVLIYLRPDAQAQALTELCAALRSGGLLVLGEAEWPPVSFAGSLTVVERRARVFRATGAARAGADR